MSLAVFRDKNFNTVMQDKIFEVKIFVAIRKFTKFAKKFPSK